MGKRRMSRPKRWAAAAQRAEKALNELEDALSELRGVQEEYEEWKDNLPDNMQNGAVAEKLEAICDLQIEDAASELRSIIDEATGIDLPMGFGRD